MAGKQIFSLLAIAAMLGGCKNGSKQLAAKKAAGAKPSLVLAQVVKIVYPYSVVPGGVSNTSDIQAAAAADRTTAQHYEGVDFAKLEPLTVRHDTHAYVSFRKNGKIYWTAKKVRIPAGERVFANGQDCIRGRCGNRISFEPRKPVLDAEDPEPSSEIFNTPAVNGLALDEHLASLLPPAFGKSAASWITPESMSSSIVPPVFGMSSTPAGLSSGSGAGSWPAGPAAASVAPSAAQPVVAFQNDTAPVTAVPGLAVTTPIDLLVNAIATPGLPDAAGVPFQTPVIAQPIPLLAPNTPYVPIPLQPGSAVVVQGPNTPSPFQVPQQPGPAEVSTPDTPRSGSPIVTATPSHSQTIETVSVSTPEPSTFVLGLGGLALLGLRKRRSLR